MPGNGAKHSLHSNAVLEFPLDLTVLSHERLSSCRIAAERAGSGAGYCLCKIVVDTICSGSDSSTYKTRLIQGHCILWVQMLPTGSDPEGAKVLTLRSVGLVSEF